jgi:membrane associated rhomboid family serine protease
LPTIGASGAIAGVMGVMYPRSRVLALIPIIIIWDIIELPAIVLLGLWFILQLFNSSTVAATAGTRGGVAFAAHVAGFVIGAISVFAFRKRRQRAWDA